MVASPTANLTQMCLVISTNLLGLSIDDERAVLLGLGWQASEASIPKGANLTLVELVLSSPMERSDPYRSSY